MEKFLDAYNLQKPNQEETENLLNRSINIKEFKPVIKSPNKENSRAKWFHW